MLKKAVFIAGIAVVHFALCIGVIPLAMSVVSENAFAPSEAATLKQILVWATRILHFPMITLSLYSRRWFPGDWIYFPIFVNSVLWALGIYLLIVVLKRFRRRKRRFQNHI